MARTGFIQGKLDTKMLTLYILSHLAGPVDFDTLTDLVMCDSGVDYFLFAEGLSELLESGHAVKDDELYLATDLGRSRSADMESSLSPVIRKRCDQRLVTLNAELKRKAQIRGMVHEQPDGSVMVELTMDDDVSRLFSLSLMAASHEDGEQITRRFKQHPNRVYNGILKVLLEDN